MDSVDYAAKATYAPEGPVDLRGLVLGTGPLELDIGYGRGRSLETRAAASPGSRIVGIEVRPKWAVKVRERCRDAGLTQVCPLAGDVRALLARSGPESCVDRVFVHFPDPWWKKRHQKRRVVTSELLSELARLLRFGGELFIQTDVMERGYDYLGLLRESSAFSVVCDGFHDDNPFGSVSNRELRATQDGLPIYRILAQRVGPSERGP